MNKISDVTQLDAILGAMGKMLPNALMSDTRTEGVSLYSERRMISPRDVEEEGRHLDVVETGIIPEGACPSKELAERMDYLHMIARGLASGDIDGSDERIPTLPGAIMIFEESESHTVRAYIAVSALIYADDANIGAIDGNMNFNLICGMRGLAEQLLLQIGTNLASPGAMRILTTRRQMRTAAPLVLPEPTVGKRPQALRLRGVYGNVASWRSA